MSPWSTSRCRNPTTRAAQRLVPRWGMSGRSSQSAGPERVVVKSPELLAQCHPPTVRTFAHDRETWRPTPSAARPHRARATVPKIALDVGAVRAQPSSFFRSARSISLMVISGTERELPSLLGRRRRRDHARAERPRSISLMVISARRRCRCRLLGRRRRRVRSGAPERRQRRSRWARHHRQRPRARPCA